MFIGIIVLKTKSVPNRSLISDMIAWLMDVRLSTLLIKSFKNFKSGLCCELIESINPRTFLNPSRLYADPASMGTITQSLA